MCKACGRGFIEKYSKKRVVRLRFTIQLSLLMNMSSGYPTIAFDYDKSPKCKNLTGQEDATDLLPEYLFISS